MTTRFIVLAERPLFRFLVTSDIGNITNVNEVYDPATDTWTRKTSAPITMSGGQGDYVGFGVSQLQAHVIDDKIYLVGGVNSEDVPIVVYDPKTDSWSSGAAMPYQNIYSTSAVFENKIYVFNSRTEIYDPQTNNWTLGQSPPYVVEGFAMATSGVMASKAIYVFSGYEVLQGWSMSMNVTNTNQIYYPQNDTWALGAAVPTNRIDFGVAELNDTFYVVGGMTRVYPVGGGWIIYDDTPSAAVEEYTPVGYGTPDPSYVLEHTPLQISFDSPLNQTYANSSIPLVFSANKNTTWISYSLDGKQNVTIADNDTIPYLTNGVHTISIYANDTYGNTANQTITFTIVKPQPFPVATIAIISIITIVGVGTGLLLFRKHRKTLTWISILGHTHAH